MRPTQGHRAPKTFCTPSLPYLVCPESQLAALSKKQLGHADSYPLIRRYLLQCRAAAKRLHAHHWTATAVVTIVTACADTSTSVRLSENHPHPRVASVAAAAYHRSMHTHAARHQGEQYPAYTTERALMPAPETVSLQTSARDIVVSRYACVTTSTTSWHHILALHTDRRGGIASNSAAQRGCTATPDCTRV